MSSPRKTASFKEDADPILTTRATARLLGVAVSTAQQWIESGALPSWKTPGGHRRVRTSAVMRLLENRVKVAQANQAPQVSSFPLDAEFQPVAEPAYPIPQDEGARLKAVHALELVGTSDNPAFDRLTWLASEITDMPMALITLLTSQRQWFVSRAGITLAETPREWAFCSHAILQDDLFVVEDAREDERFKQNPLVTGNPYIRFYAGVPLISRDGFRLGTLCVLDREARRLREKEIRALRELATIASDELKRLGALPALG
ncbi:excisionase family DNA binding protein [Paucimonas lemoignei]|uniref:Excisionase family DNA binding protein n=1 Tax=Paucimonas lemoignei TaxID=29443 RepID=A0A4R3HS62_PAULE|nr:GAF domain-containing protein [Paucimonas lemoignei]TCS35162.1 excisionase family DNA binding protein [Paucimonas lemoignei]